MYYVNTHKQCWVNSVNMILKSAIVTDYATNSTMLIAFLDKCGKAIKLDRSAKYMIAADTDLDLSTAPCFFSVGEIIADNIISFDIDTYTVLYLLRVKHFNTTMYILISMLLNGNSTVLLQDVIIAQPRVYVEGQAPTSVSRYYTKDEVDTIVSLIVESKYTYHKAARTLYLQSDATLSFNPPSEDVCIDAENGLSFYPTADFVVSPLDDIKLVFSTDVDVVLPIVMTMYIAPKDSNMIGIRTALRKLYFDSKMSDTSKKYYVYDFCVRYTDTTYTLKEGDRIWILTSNIKLYQDVHVMSAADSVNTTALLINQQPITDIASVFRLDKLLNNIATRFNLSDTSYDHVVKTNSNSTIYIDCSLSQNTIQYFSDSNNGSIYFIADKLNSIAANCTKTIQFWVESLHYNVYSFSTDYNVNVLNIPDELASKDDNNNYMIHVFTIQCSHIAEGENSYYTAVMNYNYSFAKK